MALIQEQKGCSPDISVIVPIYNEGETVSSLLEEIRQVMDPIGKPYEILAIDDGSDDGTAACLERISFIRHITHPNNRGNGAAIKSGIRNARGRLVVLMDGDGQHDPQDIPKLLAYTETYELVVGSRTEKANQSFPRYLANRLYSWLATYVSGQEILDLTSGFRVAHRDKISSFLPLFPNSFSYPTTSTLAFIRTGFGVKFVPLPMRKRKGKSKIAPFRDGLRFFLIIIRITVFFSPLKVFTPVSLFCIAAGILHALYKILLLQLRYTNLSVLFITTGLLIFFIGLVSEQISMLRFERIHSDGE